ncbi:MAG: Crp/Fnr family transcriptional regulator [Prolixibacteraceae bacterium]|nr:Crp/Fnr family transcriptional regulator [Prolixibacteraceae bacterium]MBN2775037.1 Crp/Fnr family transcriptional regulator [Prolixibacteraceae bacterium]
MRILAEPMDKSKVISRYNLTLDQIKELPLEHKKIILKKGECFIDYGEQTKKIGILISGLLYATYLSENGTEWISRFFYPPNNFIVSNHQGFYFGRNSTECIKAYDDSELIYIKKDEFKEFLDRNHQFERTVRILAEESYIQAISRIHALQSLNAKQRIEQFLKENSALAAKLQRQHIASYLGIHRNIFSRILSNI